MFHDHMRVPLSTLSVFLSLTNALMTGLGNKISPCIRPFRKFPDNLDGPEAWELTVHCFSYVPTGNYQEVLVCSCYYSYLGNFVGWWCVHLLVRLVKRTVCAVKFSSHFAIRFGRQREHARGGGTLNRWIFFNRCCQPNKYLLWSNSVSVTVFYLFLM